MSPDSGLGSFDPANFAGNPNPPPKIPEAPKQQPAAAGPETSAGTGALPPSSAGGGGTQAPLSLPAPKSGEENSYSVVRTGDGSLVGFADTREGPVRLLTVNGPEAQRVFHQEDADTVLGKVASYDAGSKTWKNVPEDTIRALAQGRPAMADYWKQHYDLSEEEALKGALAEKVLAGQMTEAEYRDQAHLATLKEQLAERPDMAWFGKAGIVADAVHHPVEAAGRAVESAGGTAAELISGIAKSLKEILKDTAVGVAAGAAAGAGATIPLGPPGMLVGAGTGAGWGARAGMAKAFYDMHRRDTAAKMLDQGYDAATVRKVAPVSGAISAALMSVGFKFLSPLAKSRFLSGLAASTVAKRALASWVVKEGATGAGLMATQAAVDEATNNIVATVKQRPELLDDPKTALLHVMDAGAKGAAGTVLVGGAAELAGRAARTGLALGREPGGGSPTPPGGIPSSAARTEPGSRGSPSGAAGTPLQASPSTAQGQTPAAAGISSNSSPEINITPEDVKVKANAEARPVLEAEAAKIGADPTDPRFTQDLFNYHNDQIHWAKKVMGIGKDLGKMTPAEKMALFERMKNLPEEQKAEIEKAYLRSSPIVAALLRKATAEASGAEDVAYKTWAKTDTKAARIAAENAAREAEAAKPPPPPPVETAPPPGAGRPDEGGRRYFQGPEAIKAGVTEQSTGKNLRDEFLGYYREQVARGNQLLRRFDREVADPMERAAIVHFADAGGDLGLIAEAAHDESIPQAARDAYERALNLSPEGQKWAATFKQFFAEAAQVGEEQGVLKSTRENYFNRVYQPAEGKAPSGVESSGNLRPSTSHARERVFDTLYDAYKAGMKPATTDPADLVRTYNNTMAKAVGSRQLLDAMQEQNLGGWKTKQPRGWEQVGDLEKNVPLKDKGGEVIITDTGDQAISRTKFYAPSELARSLKAITEPDLLRQIPGVSKAMEYQSVAKTLNLGFSLFHDISEAAQSLAAGPAGWSNFISPSEMTHRLETPEFEQQELDAIREGKLTSPIEHDNADFLKKVFNANPTMMDKLREVPGVKQALAVNDKHIESLFGKTIRFVKVNLFTQQKLAWMGEHPDIAVESPEYKQAMIEIGKHVNDVYGGQNWASRGVTKTGLALMRLTLLAPDWVVSNLNQVRDAIGGGGEATKLSRYHLATGALISTVALEGMNKIMTGHFTDKNPKGHELEVELSPDVYFSPFRGAPHDALTLYSMLAESGGAGAARFASGKGGPISRLVFTLGSGYQWNGLPVSPKNYKKGSFEEKLPKPVAGTYDEIAAAMKAGGPAPFGAVNTYDYWKQEGHLTLLGLLAVASGIGRYSKPPKEKGGDNSPISQGVKR